MDTGDRVVDDRTSGEVADVFHLYWDEYFESNGASVQQNRAVDAIMRCRTRVMGGHTNECDHCGHTEIAYNSCRNRHCPKCQSISKLRWVEARKADLLPVPYFHVIFTVSHKLYRLLIYNERFCYDLLFRCASKTLLQFADRELDGVPGITAVLHTWGQDMGRHVHLHCIVTGGALSHDHSKWNASYEEYLFDVTKMSEEFRKLYISGLRRAYGNGELCFLKKAKDLADVEKFDAFLEESKEDDWVVFCQKPFGKPKIVLEYISRYSHRIAISNSRIVNIANGRVWFKYKDYREEDAEKQKKTMSLAGCQFIKRYLQHVLPQGFTKIRHYGIYSGSNRTEKMERCRELLSAAEIEQITTRDLVQFLLETIEVDIETCPVCGLGRMVKKDMVLAEVIRCRGSTAA
jgi:hypothetical protein